MKESRAARFADLIEALAARVRAVVDRPLRAIDSLALGFGPVLLVLAAVGFLSVALFRLLAIGVGATAAFALFGAAFLAAGWWVWRRRDYVPEARE